MTHQIFQGDCTRYLTAEYITGALDLTFLDPPFNQNKSYNLHDDDMPDETYWTWMGQVCRQLYDLTSPGGAIYFMQREKNTEQVLRCLREAGWTFQNLIIWKKMTSAVPSPTKFGKHYQIIVFATRGDKPRVFHKLRIDPPLPSNYKLSRKNGMFVTDVWDDIRELTSGYFAGDEAIRSESGERFHKQQSPLALLLRIILSSSRVGDTVCDPFAGTGTTLVTAEQLGRHAIGIELDPANVQCVQDRLATRRKADSIEPYYQDYLYTDHLRDIWGQQVQPEQGQPERDEHLLDLPLFRAANPE